MIFSQSLNVFYKGSTTDVNTRFSKHLEGKSTYTSKATDWKLVFVKRFETKKEALVHEKMLKRQNRKYLLWVINQEYNCVSEFTF